jgi:hypothetical protein
MKKLTILVMLLAVSLSAQNNITNTLGADGSYSVVSSGGSTTLFKILNSGNVGIGTTSPGYKLTVVGSGESNTGVLGVNVTGNAAYTWASSSIAPNLAVGNNVIHMIGKAESAKNVGYIGFNYQGTGSEDNFLTFGLHSVDNILNITGAGNVGIGTTTPSYKLHVNGSVAGVGAYVNASDTRLKKDVVGYENGIGKVMQLRPVTFNWKQDEYPDMNLDARNHVGFIAQEVEKIVPQVVSTASDAMQTKSIAYSDLVPVLTKAIQEQQGQIEALTAQNALLKTENSGIRAENVEIKKQLESLAASVEALKNTLGGLALAK